MITRTTIVAAGPQRLRTDTASVLERRDGSLLAVYHSYSPGPDGSGDFGRARVYSSVSRDNGRSWAEERLLADIEEGDLNVMSPWLCRAGEEVLLGYVRNHSRSDTSMVLRRSRDDGECFGEEGTEYIWRHQGEYRLQGGASSMVALRDGRLVFPFQSVPEVWVEGENEYVGSYRSDDNGRSWRESRNHIRLPLRGAMEPSVAELSTGRLVMSLRTQLGSPFISYSDDRGESWSPAQTSGLKGPESCTCLRAVPDSPDHLVLFYNDAEYLPEHHHYGIRTPVSAALSTDGGGSWRKIGDIDTGDMMFTNLGCTFLCSGARKGTAVFTYMAGPDPEVVGGRWRGPVPKQQAHARTFDLRAALIDRRWFEADGGGKGVVIAMAPDFDEPLEDFEEYTP